MQRFETTNKHNKVRVGKSVLQTLRTTMALQIQILLFTLLGYSAIQCSAHPVMLTTASQSSTDLMNSDFSRTSDATTAALSSQDSVSAQAQDFVYTTDRSSTEVEATTVGLSSTAEDDDYNTRISQSSPAQSPADSVTMETTSAQVEESTQETNVNLNQNQNALFAPLVSTQTLPSSQCDGIKNYATFAKERAHEAFEHQCGQSRIQYETEWFFGGSCDNYTKYLLPIMNQSALFPPIPDTSSTNDLQTILNQMLFGTLAYKKVTKAAYDMEESNICRPSFNPECDRNDICSPELNPNPSTDQIFYCEQSSKLDTLTNRQHGLEIHLIYTMLENDLRQDVEDVDINNPSASKEMDIRRYTLIASYLSREQALRVSTDIERFCPP